MAVWAPITDTTNNGGVTTEPDLSGNGRVIALNSTANWKPTRLSTAPRPTSGKWHLPLRYIVGSEATTHIGMQPDQVLSGNLAGLNQNCATYYPYEGRVYRNGSYFSYDAGAVLSAGSIVDIDILWDATTRGLWIALDGVVKFGGGDPVAGTSPAYTDPGTDAMTPAIGPYRANAGLMLLPPPAYSYAGFALFEEALVNVSVPAGEALPAFYKNGAVLANASIRYCIFAGTGLLSAPIATGSVALDGSGLLPALSVAATTSETSGLMAWHVEGDDPSIAGAIRPVTLAAA